METRLYQEMYELEQQHWWFCARRNIIVDLIRRGLTQGKILDVGCGTGFILEKLQADYGEIYEAWGMDSAATAIAFCDQKKLVRVRQGQLDCPEGHDLPPNYFDLITFLDVIEHIEQDLAILLAAKPYLQRQGQVLITVPAYQFLWSEHDQVHHHQRRYNKADLQQLLTQAGYEILFISYFNTLLFPPIAMIRQAKRLTQSLLSMVTRFGWSSPLANFSQSQASDTKITSAWINQMLYEVFNWERKMISRLAMPFGVSLICLARKLESDG